MAGALGSWGGWWSKVKSSPGAWPGPNGPPSHPPPPIPLSAPLLSLPPPRPWVLHPSPALPSPAHPPGCFNSLSATKRTLPFLQLRISLAPPSPPPPTMAGPCPFPFCTTSEWECSPHLHSQITLCLGIILEPNLLHTAHFSARGQLGS